MVEFLAALLTWWVPFGRLRRRMRSSVVFFLHALPVRRRARSVGVDLRCLGPVHVTGRTELADHVRMHGAWVSGNGRFVVGRYCHLGEELRVFTRNHNYDRGEAIPYDDTYIAKDVVIGDFVWIGVRVLLLPGTRIGEGAIIQAGSVVHGEIPPLSIAGGNPAKVFAQRDAEHFNRLKSEGKFN